MCPVLVLVCMTFLKNVGNTIFINIDVVSPVNESYIK